MKIAGEDLQIHGFGPKCHGSAFRNPGKNTISRGTIHEPTSNTAG
jgi:hypothetical protein